MKKILQIIVFLLGNFTIYCQTIDLDFPFFAGKTYEFKIVQGDKHIVLIKDTIKKGKKVQIVIPEKFKGYKGMAMWYLTNSKTGGGLELVVNNEDFSVSCLDSIPTNESIVYQNSKENIFLNKNYQVQQAILSRYDAMLLAKKAYDKSHELYPILNKEFNQTIADFNEFVVKLAASNFYAARFQEITNLTLGIGSIITEDEKIKTENINNILVDNLNYEDLYTSNHWSGIIKSFIQLQTLVFKNDDRLIADVKTILRRISNHQVYTDFVVNLTKELTEVGKDNVITAITKEIKNSKKLLYYNGVLNVYQQDISGKAANLEIIEHIEAKDGYHQKHKTINFAQQKSKFTLMVFYQSGCGPCEETMKELQYYYKEITAKDINIITLSADTDQLVFQNTSHQFPWKDNYCDLQGFDGKNFKNFAVLGTPTLYLINKKGIIVEKMSGMKGLKQAIGLK
jgi:thiol-disulfide isomerase/thioredoxin